MTPRIINHFEIEIARGVAVIETLDVIDTFGDPQDAPFVLANATAEDGTFKPALFVKAVSSNELLDSFWYPTEGEEEYFFQCNEKVREELNFPQETCLDYVGYVLIPVERMTAVSFEEMEILDIARD